VFTQLSSNVMRAVANRKRLESTIWRPERPLLGFLFGGAAPSLRSRSVLARWSAIRASQIEARSGSVASSRRPSVGIRPETTRRSVIQDPLAAPAVAPIAISGIRRSPASLR
jgi:hypothetical protein